MKHIMTAADMIAIGIFGGTGTGITAPTGVTAFDIVKHLEPGWDILSGTAPPTGRFWETEDGRGLETEDGRALELD